jgi:hypothetical protein
MNEAIELIGNILKFWYDGGVNDGSGNGSYCGPPEYKDAEALYTKLEALWRGEQVCEKCGGKGWFYDYRNRAQDTIGTAEKCSCDQRKGGDRRKRIFSETEMQLIRGLPHFPLLLIAQIADLLDRRSGEERRDIR